MKGITAVVLMGSNFSSQLYCLISHKGNENKGNDHQKEKLTRGTPLFSLSAPKEMYKDWYGEYA